MKTLFQLAVLFLFVSTGYSMGAKTPEGVSLLLVPARPAMVQLGMDMASQEHALLMTYAPNTPPEEMFIHIWDGTRWLEVPNASFELGNFVKNPVSRLLVVGDENDLTATLIEEGLVWSPEVLHLGSADVTELINQMGRLYGFDKKDWVWIANRYELQLENLNQDRPQVSWYDENKASNLPPSEKPWKKSKQNQMVQPPETSLSQMTALEGVVEEEEVEEESVTEEIEIESVPEIIVPQSEDSESFSLEFE